MGDVTRFPVIPRPRPVQHAEPFKAMGDPHTDAKTALQMWEDFALENCGADWTAKVLEDRLWRARQRRLMEQR